MRFGVAGDGDVIWLRAVQANKRGFNRKSSPVFSPIDALFFKSGG
jgi:hypothetical protein